MNKTKIDVCNKIPNLVIQIIYNLVDIEIV